MLRMRTRGVKEGIVAVMTASINKGAQVSSKANARDRARLERSRMICLALGGKTVREIDCRMPVRTNTLSAKT